MSRSAEDRAIDLYNQHVRKKARFNNIEKGAAMASGAMLGFIGMNVPGAVLGARIGYDLTADLPEKNMASKSSGFYRGKVPYPKRYKSTLETRALQRGYHTTQEVYGRVVDANTVYIMHSTWAEAQFTTAMTGAIIRKLFLKAGIPISHGFDELPLQSATNAAGFRIEIHPINAVNAAGATVVYDTVDGDTLNTIVSGWAAGRAAIANFITTASVAEPWEARLSYAESAVFRLASRMNLSEEVVTFFASSSLKFQNRTSGDTGVANNEADRVDNQPLVGKVYKFKHADPRLKHNSSQLLDLNTIGGVGIRLIKASTLPAAFQNRPDPKTFSNCSATSNFVINPGELKRSYVQYQITGTMTNVLKKLRVVSPTVATTGAQGRSELICFEELLKTAGTNPVTVQYEQQLKVGIILKTKASSAMSTVITNTTLDLL